ncbi:MAG: DUF4838 domain-containing protein [Lentisphaeria bacterium]|nr:DUF4838 domain-containing protein [Lentisphaeria bacterium]
MKKRWKTALVLMAALALAGCSHNEKPARAAKPAVKQAAKPAAEKCTEKGFVLGGSDMTVYHPKQYQSLAAEAAGYLKKVFGKEYTLKACTAADKDKPGIFIGILPSGVKFAVDAKKEFCGKHVTDTQVFLFGNNAKLLRGTEFSVYDFLEKEAGVRWLWPGELGTVAEPQEPKALKNGTEIFVPAFDLRMTNSFHYGMANMPVRERRDLNSWLVHQKVGTSLFAVGTGFQHAFSSLLPREKYGKEHPEYYSLVTPGQWIGEPKPDKPTRRNDPGRLGPWQLCTSNPEVRRIIAEKLASFKDGKIRSISPNDGWGFCECPNCLAQDGKPRPLIAGARDTTNRMYDFAEDIAKQVKKLNPNAKIGMFAYGFYAGVPDRKIDFPGNVYLSFCYSVNGKDAEQEKALEKHLTGLAATGGRVIGREYWGTHYTMNYPLSHSRKIDRNLKLLHKLNAAGIYGEPGKDFAARASDLYILLKLSWDPTLKREDILHDFCNKGFGPKAGPVMYELFEKIEDWTSQLVEKREKFAAPFRKEYDNGYAANNYAKAQCYNADFQKMCAGYMNKALKLAETLERKERIEFIRSGIKRAERTSNVLNAFSDLAAIGINMPLTQPSGKEIRMEKRNLQKVVSAAAAAVKAYQSFHSVHSPNNAFSNGVIGSMTKLSLRPWFILTDKARLDLSANRFNYMVNGAFEYTTYSWKTDAQGGAKVFATHECNHDADDNYMVQCHGRQGISLEVSLPAESSAELIQKRKISPAQDQLVNFKLFVKCAKDPLNYMTVEFAGQKLTGYLLPPDIEDGSGWNEIRFKQIKVPAGDHEFKITFRNGDKEPVTLHLDDLVLRMKEASR